MLLRKYFFGPYYFAGNIYIMEDIDGLYYTAVYIYIPCLEMCRNIVISRILQSQKCVLDSKGIVVFLVLRKKTTKP
jgi:hypothetical protein